MAIEIIPGQEYLAFTIKQDPVFVEPVRPYGDDAWVVRNVKNGAELVVNTKDITRKVHESREKTIKEALAEYPSIHKKEEAKLTKKDIVVNGIYTAKVNGTVVRVRVTAIDQKGGFDVVNLMTNRPTHFKSAAKFRTLVMMPPPIKSVKSGRVQTAPKPSPVNADAPPLNAKTASTPKAHGAPRNKREAKEAYNQMILDAGGKSQVVEAHDEEIGGKTVHHSAYTMVMHTKESLAAFRQKGIPTKFADWWDAQRG